MRRISILLIASGCVFPVSSGPILPPSTVGKGRFGFSANGELPVPNLVADTNPASKDYEKSVSIPMTDLSASYGVAERTDVEAVIHWFDLILPHGGALGVRQNLVANDDVDLGVAARVGGLSNLTTTDTSKSNTGVDLGPSLAATAWYGSAQASVELHGGRVRPMFAVSETAYRVKRDVEPPNTMYAVTERYWGFATAATFALWVAGDRVRAAPYATLTYFSSGTFDGGWIASGGIAVALRGIDRQGARPPPPPPPSTTGPMPIE